MAETKHIQNIKGGISTGESSVISVKTTNKLTADGTFDTDSGWTYADWTIADGKATHTTGNLTPLKGTTTVESTKQYRVDFTIADHTIGDGVTISLVSASSSHNNRTISGNGIHYEYIYGIGNNAAVWIIPSSTFNGSITDVAIYEVVAASPDIIVRASNAVVTNDIDIRTAPVNAGFPNTAIGKNAGQFLVDTGYGNTIIGSDAARSASYSDNNVIIGTDALKYTAWSRSDVFIGYKAGENAQMTADNVAIGNGAMIDANAGITTGNAVANSVAIGKASLKSVIGDDNTAVGFSTARGTTTGEQNTNIGSMSGYTNITGSRNVFVGYGSGYYETGSDKLFIDNRTRASESDARAKALIYGVFDADTANQQVTVNGALTSTTINAITPTVIAGGTTGFTLAGGGKTLTVLQNSGGVIPGTEILWPSETVPAGYLEENGASLLIADYADLYAVIGKMYGSADATHFNLPDMRGKFPRIWDHAAAIDPDRATRTAPTATGATISAGDHVGTEQDHAVESHVHLIGYSGSASSAGVTQDASSADRDWATGVNSAAEGGNETRPINVYRMMIIKY